MTVKVLLCETKGTYSLDEKNIYIENVCIYFLSIHTHAQFKRTNTNKEKGEALSEGRA
jgi:hypothetical protein